MTVVRVSYPPNFKIPNPRFIYSPPDACPRFFCLVPAFPCVPDLFLHCNVGAYVCMFAEDVVNAFLRSHPLSSLYSSTRTFSEELVELKRQEIGKVASRYLHDP